MVIEIKLRQLPLDTAVQIKFPFAKCQCTITVVFPLHNPDIMRQ